MATPKRINIGRPAVSLKKKRKLNGKSEMSTRLHASLWKSVSKKKLGKKKTSNPSIVSKRRVIRVDFLVFRVEM